MKDEIKLFLPPSLKQVDLLEHHVQVALKQDSLTVPPTEHGPATESAKDTEKCASKTKAGEYEAVGHCPTYLKCSAIQNNLGCDGKCLETCFVYLPSWDDFQFELHYINVRVYPVQPQSSILSRIMHRGHEKIELVGTRSIMKFSILTPTAIETVKLLESKGKPVSEEAIKFLKQANMFTIVAAKALDDEKKSTKPDSDQQCDRETSADKPHEESDMDLQ